MHNWELESDAARRAARDSSDPSSYQGAVLDRMNAVFMEFCTPRSRPQGRLGSFRNPPEYDPQHETIVSAEVTEPDRAHVETDREAVVGGGRYRYVLHREAGRWLIDSLKHHFDGTWKVWIL